MLFFTTWLFFVWKVPAGFFIHFTFYSSFSSWQRQLAQPRTQALFFARNVRRCIPCFGNTPTFLFFLIFISIFFTLPMQHMPTFIAQNDKCQETWVLFRVCASSKDTIISWWQSQTITPVFWYCYTTKKKHIKHVIFFITFPISWWAFLKSNKNYSISFIRWLYR